MNKYGHNPSPTKIPGGNAKPIGIPLTQEFIVLKTRQAMEQIVKLNLWGNNLSDASIVQNIPRLEILALTVNQITTLKDFQNCS